MISKAALVANLAARKASWKKIEAASAILRRNNVEHQVFVTEKRGDGTGLARKAVELGAGLVIAAGGDGTFNEVMNGIAGTGAAMALLPMGTTNVLAKELRIPETIEGAMEVALHAAGRTVSLGRIEWGGLSRLYLLMAGIGFDAAAVYGVNRDLKKYSGRGGYVMSGVRTLLGWNPSPLRVKADGGEYECSSLIVCKGASYGGYFRAAPDARLDDPSLHAVLMHGRSRLDALRYAVGLLRGTHTSMKDVTYVRCSEVGVEGDAHIQIDGDYLGRTPCRIAVEKDAARLVY